MRRVLIVHNRYQQRGGEDAAVERESRLLREAGFEVFECIRTNDDIAGFGARISAALNAAHSPGGVRLVREAIARVRPDVMHVHNTFPLFSPAIHKAAREMGVATVQTLHNYRTVCANGFLLRRGRPCEDCIGGSPYQAALHRCYRGSLPGSIVAARMVATHRRIGTWRHDVDLFLALNEFARGLFVRAGLPADRIAVKPNAVDDPGPPTGGARHGVVFVGRLSAEKGVRELVAAAAMTQVPVAILGDGPLSEILAASAPPNVTMLGRCAPEAVRRHLAAAAAIVVPSLWYESFPLVIAEAFAAATPAIVSRIGSLAEIVRDGETGVHVTAGDPADLARAIARMAGDGALARRLGLAARAEFERSLTPRANVEALALAYERALRNHRQGHAENKNSQLSAGKRLEPDHGLR